MDCEKVRDQFSSLLEGELKPEEEETIREHLGSCPGCQKEWVEFNRMMDWLHSVEEEDVPEGFLSEIQKKRKERKGKQVRTEAWFLRSAKIPIQAAAMVMIVFLALYLTKMSPFDIHQEGDVKRPEVQQQDIEKKEQAPRTTLNRGDIPKTKPSAGNEKIGGKDPIVQKMKDGEEKPAAPPFKEESAAAEAVRTKEMSTAAAPSMEEKRREQDTAERVKMPLAKKVAHEITLKIKDRERASLQVEELAKQLGGEVVREEGDLLVASLPASSLGPFEKGLARVGILPVASKSAGQQDLKKDLRAAGETKSKGIEEKVSVRPMSSREDTVSIRIRLIPE